MKPVYIAAYHQSEFGKLLDLTVPEIVGQSIRGACGEMGVLPETLDVGSIGAACNFSLNEQGLLAGLMAMVPGLEGKPRFWLDGKARPDGECGINTSGGLIAKGHPIGATGVAMIGWAAWQLLGKVPPALQVKSPRLAATFNIGGPICASVCTVLRAA